MSWRGFLRRRYWDKERIEEMEAHLAHEIEGRESKGARPTPRRAPLGNEPHCIMAT